MRTVLGRFFNFYKSFSNFPCIFYENEIEFLIRDKKVVHMSEKTKTSIQALLEKKQAKSNEQNNRKARPTGTIGEYRKAVKQKRGGGLFDGK